MAFGAHGRPERERERERHFNGQAERMKRILKKQVHWSFEGRKYTHEETCKILQETVQVVNSRSLAVSPWDEKEALCPEDLMLVRAGVGIPSVSFEMGLQLIKRFWVVQKAKEEFWDRWVQKIFPSLLRHKKWYKYKQNARAGDVVLKKDDTAAGQTYKYARIIKVYTGTDGKVRSADVEEQTMEEAEGTGDVEEGKIHAGGDKCLALC